MTRSSYISCSGAMVAIVQYKYHRKVGAGVVGDFEGCVRSAFKVWWIGRSTDGGICRRRLVDDVRSRFFAGVRQARGGEG